MRSTCSVRFAAAEVSLACLMAVAVPRLSGANVSDSTRIRLNDSFVAVPGSAGATETHVVRAVLTADETAAPLNIVVNLRMRRFEEFEARIQRGEIISRAEMEATYLPLAADYQRTVSWLRQMGLTPTLVDKNHTNVFGTGSVAQLSRAFDVTFARVATADGEFTSSVTAPSLPAEFADAVLGVMGLQPHIVMHAAGRQEPAGNELGGNATPADVLTAYDVPISNDGNGNPINGSGQTIALVMAAVPSTATFPPIGRRSEAASRSATSRLSPFREARRPQPRQRMRSKSRSTLNGRAESRPGQISASTRYRR